MKPWILIRVVPFSRAALQRLHSVARSPEVKFKEMPSAEELLEQLRLINQAGDVENR